MTKLHDLAGMGQSVWIDFIRRSFITSGDLQKLIDEGARGVTSNPTIFSKAIVGSNDYDKALKRIVDEGKSIEGIYEALAVEDIAAAADLMLPVWEQSKGADGFVSLEVSPKLAHDTAGTVADARRLYTSVGRPNVMIKVPATHAGMPAVKTLIAEGINVNVTLIFSLKQYEDSAEAYINGLEKRMAAGGDLSLIGSVASFFVSRVDSLLDPILAEHGAEALQGKIAIANAKAAYARFEEIFGGPRWQRLAECGARVQRPLWASTSTKNPAYPDTLYVDELIGPHTVNTMPLDTLEAYKNRGRLELSVGRGLDEARSQLAELQRAGIDLRLVTEQLLDEGLASFEESYDTLLASVEEKADLIRTL